MNLNYTFKTLPTRKYNQTDLTTGETSCVTVTKKETCYQGHTCLTLDMAYNNARLIAKPESNWLSQ